MHRHVRCAPDHQLLGAILSHCGEQSVERGAAYRLQRFVSLWKSNTIRPVENSAAEIVQSLGVVGSSNNKDDLVCAIGTYAKATHVYNRYPYDREKKIALETWERVLTGILTNTSSANVLIFTQAPAIKASK